MTALFLVLGCSSQDGPSANDPAGPTDPTPELAPPPAPAQTPATNLDDRKIDYQEAFRSASMKLVDALPTWAEVNRLEHAADVKAEYAKMIDERLADPRFATKQIRWWKDTFKTGSAGPRKDGAPDMDAAATFAAQVVVTDRPYTDLFTATSGTCPTYQNGAFAPGDCPGAQPTAGVLTDPGLMTQYFANLAFRRVRFVQETFACSKFPAELSATPKAIGQSAYTSPWDIESISDDTIGRINFRDTRSLICANCHTTLNHVAPLFAYFDENGTYKPGKISVPTPLPMSPVAQMTDWLPPGQQLAWRFGKPTPDLPSLGKAIAQDPAVLHCAVDRVWNWVMSRGDIVNDLASVPPQVTQPLVDDFVANGTRLRRVIRNAFTSDDFVKF